METGKKKGRPRRSTRSKIGDELIRVREAAGIGVYELASRIGITPQTIYDIECGTSNGRAETFVAIDAEIGSKLLEFWIEHKRK